MALPLPGGPDPDPARQQKFDVLARAMAGFGGKSVEIRYGTGTWTWPGAALGSTPQQVDHGLGRTAVVAWAFPITGPQGNALTGIAYTYTTTQFTTHGIFASFSPAAAATAAFGWIAIG